MKPDTRTVRCVGLLLTLGLALPAHAALDAVFDPAFERGRAAPQTALERWRALRERQHRYRRLLETDDGFDGLFLRLEGAASLEHGGERRLRYGIDWELFANGRHEARRARERKRVESEVQLLQLLADMRARVAAERRDLLSRMRLRVEHEWLRARVALLEVRAEREARAARAGFLLRERLEQTRAALRTARARLDALGEIDTAMPADWRALLNRIEHAAPAPVERLLRETLANAPRLRLQALFEQRADFHRTWTDDLETRLYVERVHDRFTRHHDTIAGVRVRLPLERPAGRDRLVALERALYRDQAEAIRERLRQRVTLLVERWNQHRGMLQARLRELARIEREIPALAAQARQALPSLPHTPARRRETLRLRRLDLQREILEERLQILGYLIDLAELSGAARLDALLSSAQ